MLNLFGRGRILRTLAAAFVLSAVGSEAQSLVQQGDTWRYRKGTSAPQINWKTAADTELHASWLTGKGGFGYADNSPEVSLCQTILNDMHGSYSTVDSTQDGSLLRETSTRSAIANIKTTG